MSEIRPDSTVVDRYSARIAPGALQVVQSLANTIAIGSHADLLADLGTAVAWLNDIRPLLILFFDWKDSEDSLDASGLDRLRQLRAAVRVVLGLTDHKKISSSVTPNFTSIEVITKLQMNEQGITALPTNDPAERICLSVIIALWETQLAGNQSHLKLCRNPHCRAAFYDASRNQSGAWHSGTSCGNISRVHAYRALKVSNEKH